MIQNHYQRKFQQKTMDQDRLNEYLEICEKELEEANRQLSLLVENDEVTDQEQFTSEIEALTSQISKITREMESLLNQLG
jgi:uncharacterized protein Yka (UPF0111/DUF47 family)